MCTERGLEERGTRRMARPGERPEHQVGHPGCPADRPWGPRVQTAGDLEAGAKGQKRQTWPLHMRDAVPSFRGFLPAQLVRTMLDPVILRQDT